QRQGEIAQFWQRQQTANPAYFNGTVLLFSRFAFEGDALVATAFPTEFRNYLYWRTQGFEDRTVIDGFGSAIIRSAEGAVMLARQRAGNINSGLYYLPGGFIDPRDVGPGGAIDIAASIAREVGEETGLHRGALQLDPGFVVTRAGAHLSIAATWRSPLCAEALRAAIMGHLAADAASELEEVVFASSLADTAGLRLADYCKPLIPVLLARNAL
ncbi:MAG: NUDIX hydrolase, partial [Hyphomicrobiaceae bacterium]